CANLLLLRCGVKRKTAPKGRFCRPFRPLSRTNGVDFTPPQGHRPLWCGPQKRNRMISSAKSNRWPPVWVITLAATLLPPLWIAGLALAGAPGAHWLKQAINFTGDWSIYLLLVPLAVTPARHILAAPRLLLARRTLGLVAFGYAALHLVLYALDLDLD